MRRATWLAWAWCVVVLGVAVGMYLYDLQDTTTPQSWIGRVGQVIWGLVLPMTFATVAALIISRHPRNTIGWLLMVPAALYLYIGPLEQYVKLVARSNPEPSTSLLLLVWVNGWSWLLLIFPLLHIPLLFPNGRPPTPRWRWVSTIAIVWAILFAMMSGVTDVIQSNTTPNIELRNPIGFIDTASGDAIFPIWVVGLAVLAVLCVAALIVRFRHGSPAERSQIDWLLYASAVFLVIYVVGGLLLNMGGSTTPSLADEVYGILIGLSVIAFPVAIGIAILRHRLFDIDVVVRRTLVYAVLTGALALVYFGSVFVFQSLFQAATGQRSDLALVGSTLAIAVLFQPLRRRIQTIIDRRFFRRTYNAAAVLARHAAILRDEVDVARLTTALVRAADDSTQPTHAALWLRLPEKKP